MKLLLNKNLFDHHGEKIKESNEENAEFSRLGVYLVEGLLRELPGDNGGGARLKVKRWEMARKIQKAMQADTSETCTLELPTEDVAMIKTRIENFMPAVLVGPVFEAIEGDGEAADVRSIR